MLNLFCTKCNRMVQVEPVEKPTDACLAHCPVCGSDLAGQRYIAPGTQIAGYVVKSEIGRGGMGVVYLARQLDLDRDVALKILSDEMASDGEFQESFFREAKAAAALNHPNIVQAIECGTAANSINYFAMELIEGENLDILIRRDGPLPIARALKCATRIADALHYAWDYKKLTHRDIKPENIIYLPKIDDFKLADLGLAKEYRDSTAAQDKNDNIMITPAYAPPEVIRGEKVLPAYKSDMYSFGATLYHIFSGRPPFDGKTVEELCRQQQEEQTKPLIGIDRTIPSRLSMLVDKLMEKDPEKRPADWQGVLNELNKIAETYYYTPKTAAGERAHLKTQDNDPDKAKNALNDLMDGNAGDGEEELPNRVLLRYGLLGFAILLFVISLGGFLWTLQRKRSAELVKNQPQPPTIVFEEPKLAVPETPVTPVTPVTPEVAQPVTGENQPAPETAKPEAQPVAPVVVEIDPWDKVKEKINPLLAKRSQRNCYLVWVELQAYDKLVGDSKNPEYYPLILDIQEHEYKKFAAEQERDVARINSSTTPEKLQAMSETELVEVQRFIRNFIRTARAYAEWTPTQCPDTLLREYEQLASKKLQAEINLRRHQARVKAVHDAEMKKSMPVEFNAVVDKALTGTPDEFERVAKAWIEKYQGYTTDEDTKKIETLRNFCQANSEPLFVLFAKYFQRDGFKNQEPFPQVYKKTAIHSVRNEGKTIRMLHSKGDGLREVKNFTAEDWKERDGELLEDFILHSGLFPKLFFAEQKALLNRAAANGVSLAKLKSYVETNLNISGEEFAEMFDTLNTMQKIGVIR